jgi:hypothetical protein
MSIDEFVESEAEQCQEPTEQQELETTAIHEFKEPFAQRAYRFFVDGLSNFAYGVVVMAPTEYFCVGLEPKQIAVSRAMNFVSSMLIGGPYGSMRNKCFAQYSVTEQSPYLHQLRPETLAIMRMMPPLYPLIIAALGADLDECVHGFMTIFLLAPVFGATMGPWADAARRLFKVRTARQYADEVIKQYAAHTQ